MLTLDETTLYYFFLSDSASAMDSKEFSTGINDWAASIPENSKPGSKANTSQPSIFKNRSASRRNGSVLPPLTNGSTRSSSNSVLTNNVLISHAEPIIRIKEEPKKNYHLGVIDGGLSDEDETQGLEREAAVASPPKGKKRVTSSVSVCFDVMFISTTTDYYRLLLKIPPSSQ
jgi:hypothetical protein